MLAGEDITEAAEWEVVKQTSPLFHCDHKTRLVAAADS